MSNEKAPEETLEVVAPEAAKKQKKAKTPKAPKTEAVADVEATEPEPEALPKFESPDGDLHSPIIGKWSKGTRRQQRAEARNNEAGK